MIAQLRQNNLQHSHKKVQHTNVPRSICLTKKIFSKIHVIYVHLHMGYIFVHQLMVIGDLGMIGAHVQHLAGMEEALE